MMPLVSVIVPVHNGVKFLADAVESIRAQTYTPMEIIVVDDGSTDGTVALARSLGEDIRIIEQPKRGPAAARNAGIRAASGEILAFLDADDLWNPDKLTRQVAHLLDNDLDIVTGYVQMISLLGAEATPPHAPGRSRNIPYLDVNLGAMICRRNVFDQVGLLDEALPFAEDVDWYLRVQETNLRVCAIRAITLIYRRHPSNVTVTGDGISAAANYYRLVLRHAEERRGIRFDPAKTDALQLDQYLQAAPELPIPSVTVILLVIPQYMQDEGAWRRSLDSLAGQNVDVLDVIIVSPEALPAPKSDLPVRVIQVDSQSMPVLLNAGISAAQGELIAFMTPDDLREPGSIAQQVEPFLKQPFLEYGFGFRRFVHADGIPVRWLNEDGSTGHYFQPTIGTLVARRSVFERDGLFDHTFPVAYDLAWFNAIMDRGVPYYILQQDMTQHVVHASHSLAIQYDAYLAELPRIRYESIKRRRHEVKYRST